MMTDMVTKILVPGDQLIYNLDLGRFKINKHDGER